MNAEWKKKWVEALRSGEYEQGKNSLVIKSEYSLSYCCLGVLCDLVAKEEDGYEWIEKDSMYPIMKTPKGDASENLPPGELAELVGLERRAPELMLDGDKIGLIVLNDKEGLSFTQIADLIEEQL